MYCVVILTNAFCYRSSKCKKTCFLHSCSSTVVNLPRHLREVHGWPAARAKKAVGLYGLRRPYEVKNKDKTAKKDKTAEKDMLEEKTVKKYKNYHKKRMCPVLGCYSANMRMSSHLQDIHKITKGSTYYYTLLKEAKPFVTRKICKEIEKAADVESEIDLHNNGSIDFNVEEDEDEDQDEDQDQDQDGASQDIDSLFDQFVQYKVSVDGGKGDKKSAMQSRQELLYILRAINSNEPSALLDKWKVRDKFLSEYAEKTKNYKALTIKRYLLSLVHFYDFLLTDEIKIAKVTPEDILRMKVTVSRWSKSYNGTAELEQQYREMEEQAVLITPAQIRIYESSEGAREAATILGTFSSPLHSSTLSKQEYTCVRDYLLTEIEIVSCHRSGVSSNMTVDEVLHAKLKDGKHIIRVMKHKTIRKHGPALLCVTDILYRHLKLFIEKIRSQVASDLPNVFVSYYGKALNSGAISKQINSTWQRAGVYGDNKPPLKKNISSNIFRKSGSTIIEDENPEGARYVASLLTHSEATSKKHYRLTEKEKFALRGTSELEKTFSKRTSIDCASSVVSKKSRFEWSSAEVSELKTVFNEYINAKTIQMDTVRSLRGKLNLLCDLSGQRIYDKLRSFWRYSPDDATSTMGGMSLLIITAVVCCFYRCYH